MIRTTAEFFITGGTLRPDAPSYVERRADDDLFRWLRDGEFCYVLTPRQMGKSSLMVRTAARLKDAGVATLVLDLTVVGQGVTQEQWYQGLLQIVGEQLDLEQELEECWRSHDQIGPTQRWFTTLTRTLLPRFPEGLTIFVDEIDAVQALPFPTDDFFAAVRACYNQRTTDPEFQRLTFCLLGVATPTDLIRDTRNTPFNIGRRVELKDFTEEEAGVLAQGLRREATPTPAAARALLERALYWTSGHPCLTQQLCKAVADDPTSRRPGDVDRICASLFFAPGALRRDEHLLFVQECLLRATPDLTGLLRLYERVRDGGMVEDDETSPFTAALRLSGITRNGDGRLRVRNRIYRTVFDADWVQRHLPGVELRRQRAAFRQGLVRGALAAGLLALLIGVLALAALWNAYRARRLTTSLRTTVGQRDQVVAELRRTAAEREGALSRLRSAFGALREERGLLERKAEALQRSETGERTQRLAAQRSSRVATAAERKAEFAARLAQFRGKETRQQLAVLQEETGTALIRDRHLLDALPWLLAAQRLEGGSHGAASNRALAASLIDESPRLAQLWTNASSIRKFSFTSDGDWLVVGYDDGSIELRSTHSEQVRVIRPPQRDPALRELNVLLVSRDSPRLIVGAGSEERVVEIPSGRIVCRLQRKPNGALWGAAFVQHGKVATLDGDNRRLQLWDAVSGAYVRDVATLPPFHWANIASLGTSDRLLVMSSPESYVLSLSTGAILGRTDQRIDDWAVSPDGNHLVARQGLNALFFQLPDFRELPGLQLAGETRTIQFVSDTLLRCVETDGLVEEWNPFTARRAGVPFALPGPVASAVVAPQASEPNEISSRRIVTIDSYGVARSWDLLGRTRRVHIIYPAIHSSRAAFDPSGRVLAIPGHDGFVRLLDADTQKPVRSPLRLGEEVRCVAFSNDGAWIAAAGENGSPRLWSLRTGQEGPPLAVVTDPSHLTGFQHLTFSPQGRYLLAYAFSGAHKVAELYDLHSRRPLATIPGEYLRTLQQPFSPDERFLVIRSSDGGARIWRLDLPSPRPGKWLDGGHNHDEFSPDGSQLLTEDAHNVVRLLRTSDGAEVTGKMPSGDRISFAGFSRDGRRILVCGADGINRLWDARLMRPVGRTMRTRASVKLATFAADGKKLALLTGHGELELWDVARGEPLAAPVFVWDNITEQIRFSQDGQRVLLISTDDGTAAVVSSASVRRSISDQLCVALAGMVVRDRGGPDPVPRDVTALAWKHRRAFYPAPTPLEDRESITRWHHDRWIACAVSGSWDLALEHLNNYLARDASGWHPLTQRALLEMQLSQWASAARDLRALALRDQADYLGHYRWAVTMLAAGDEPGYREACSRMLERFGRDHDSRTRELTAWTCALAPGNRSDLERAVAELQQLLPREPDNSSWRSTLGALLFRLGRYQEALGQFQPVSTSPKGLYDNLFRALTEHALGRDQNARAVLALVEPIIAEGLKPDTATRSNWDDRVVISRLLQEVHDSLAVGAHSPAR